jgi:hypothetical protein
MGPWEALVFRTLILSLRLNIFYSLAGAGKSVLTYATISIFPFRKLTNAVTQFFNYRGYPKDVHNWTGFTRLLLL